MNNKASCFCYQLSSHKGDHSCRCGGNWDQKGHSVILPDIRRGFGAYPLTEEEKKILSNKGFN